MKNDPSALDDILRWRRADTYDDDTDGLQVLRAADLELERLRDAELIARFALRFGVSIRRYTDGVWTVSTMLSWYELPDDGTGLPLLDDAAREAMEKEINKETE